MEQSKHVGTIQIALFDILSDIRIVIGQFIVATLAFSFALVKVFMAEQTFIGESGHANDLWVNTFKLFDLNLHNFLFNRSQKLFIDLFIWFATQTKIGLEYNDC